MTAIVECVPNFAEGRRAEVVDDIVRAMLTVPVKLLDREMDANHNRAVITIAGGPDAVSEAAFLGTARAAQRIDLNVHRGEHPRIGATDVIPFIPIQDVTMEECVALAHRVGRRIAAELDIPVYFYERAALRPERRDLAYIRRGEYEALKAEIATDPDRAPDAGPRRVGPAGATVVGARPFLIAYNVNLKTDDLRVAREIAKIVREKGGGLPSVKALGFALQDRGIVQVSMNLTDFHITGMLTAFETVKAEAARRGVEVLESELVGLAPLESLLQVAAQALKLPSLKNDQIVETRLNE